MGMEGGRGRCGTDCHTESLGSGIDRDAHDCSSCRDRSVVLVSGFRQ